MADWKAMREPSGDQRGLVSGPGCVTSGVTRIGAQIEEEEIGRAAVDQVRRPCGVERDAPPVGSDVERPDVALGASRALPRLGRGLQRLGDRQRPELRVPVVLADDGEFAERVLARLGGCVLAFGAAKTMVVPSGVHSWLAIASSCFESTSASPPSGRIAWICPLPSTLRRKVIHRLSGDHSMSPADSLPRVSCVTVPRARVGDEQLRDEGVALPVGAGFLVGDPAAVR